jgi:hypothetical protein
MEGSRPLRTLRRTIQERTSNVLSQRFFHDRLSMAVLFAALAVNVVSLVSLALRLQPLDSPVPVHFSSFARFDQLGPWYFPLQISLVALGITIMNAIFAYSSFTRSRLASFFLLVTSLVVGIFAAIIAQAFGSIQ